ELVHRCSTATISPAVPATESVATAATTIPTALTREAPRSAIGPMAAASPATAAAVMQTPSAVGWVASGTRPPLERVAAAAAEAGTARIRAARAAWTDDHLMHA